MSLHTESRPPVFAPMLAMREHIGRPSPGFSPAEWHPWVEIKWDGYRCLAYLDGGKRGEAHNGAGNVATDGISGIRNAPGTRLFSRRQKELTSYFPELARLHEQVTAAQAVLDGELVAFAGGRPSFHHLQTRLGLEPPAATGAPGASITYVAFDLLSCDGELLLDRPLRERRARLESITNPAGHLQLSPVFQGRPDQLLAKSMELGLEGIVVKDPGSPYVPGQRPPFWRKLKVQRQREVLVAGFTAEKGAVRALLLASKPPGHRPGDPARHHPGSLHYLGRVGTGFSNRQREEWYQRLLPLRRPQPPFHPVPPDVPHGAIWVEPVYTCRVGYLELTPHGRLRHPTFLGMAGADGTGGRARTAPVEGAGTPGGTEAPQGAETLEGARTSKGLEAPEGVSTGGRADTPGDGAGTGRGRVEAAQRSHPGVQVVEKQAVMVDGREFVVSHLDRVLWPDTGWTKADLMHYLVQVAPAMLPHLRDRPLTLVRCPEGAGGERFYQKNRPGHTPGWIATYKAGTPEGTEFILANDLPTLIWLANLNALEFHPWLARAQAPAYPTATVVDIDPMPPTGFEEARQVAFWVKELLDHLNLASFPKLSGATGIHIYVPLDGRTTFARSRGFAQWVSAAMAHLYPEHTTDIRQVDRRGPRVYVDPLQNSPHKTIAAPYSPRALPGGQVSTPVTWDELASVQPGDFTIKTVPARIQAVGDLFSTVLELEQALPDVERLPQPGRV